MKVKTSELKDRALDYAVARADGYVLFLSKDWRPDGTEYFDWYCEDKEDRDYCDICPSYTTGPAGDDIIDRESISTMVDHSNVWIAFSDYNYAGERRHMVPGTTRREAAMRCYVSSKLGDEVEIPEKLC